MSSPIRPTTKPFNLLLLALVAFGTVAALAPPRAGAWDLRIGTRTRLTSTTTVQGTRVGVDGYLRDNVGQGVPGMAISIDFEKVAGSTGVIRRDVITDRTGRYFVALSLPAGRYKGKVRYSGQQYYFEGAEVDLGEVQTRRGEVELSLQHPVVARQGWTVKAIVAAISGGEPVEHLPLEVTVGDAELAVETGDAGTVAFPVDLSEAKGGTFPISARLVDARDFLPSEARGSIRVIDRPSLSLEADLVRARLQRGLMLSGDFVDRFGGIGEQPVTLIVSSKGVETARFVAKTNADGGYEFFVAEDKLPVGDLEIEGLVTLARGESVVAPAASLHFDKTGSGTLLWLIGLVLGSSLMLIVGVGVRDLIIKRRREERDKPKRVSPRAARQPGVVAIDRTERPEHLLEAGDDAIGGILQDAQTKEPLANALVRLSEDLGQGIDALELPTHAEVKTNDEGHFTFEPPPRGNYVLIGQKRGYVSGRVRLSVPHKGRFSWVGFPLTPVRVVVRDLYEGLVEDLAMRNAAWGRMTPRQVYRLLVKAVARVVAGEHVSALDEGFGAFESALGELLAATRGERERLTGARLVEVFTHLIEEVYFSQRMHDEQIIQISERLADAIRQIAKERAFSLDADEEDES